MEKLGIDIKLLIAQAINFVLFFLIVKKYLAKPFSQFLKAEKEKDQEKELALSQAKKLEEELKTKEEKFKKDSQKEIKMLLEKAKKEAEAIKKEIIEKAEKEALAIKDKAKKQVEHELRKEKEEIKKQMVDEIYQLFNKTFNNLDKETQRKLTQSILKGLN